MQNNKEIPGRCKWKQIYSISTYHWILHISAFASVLQDKSHRFQGLTLNYEPTQTYTHTPTSPAPHTQNTHFGLLKNYIIKVRVNPNDLSYYSYCPPNPRDGKKNCLVLGKSHQATNVQQSQHNRIFLSLA